MPSVHFWFMLLFSLSPGYILNNLLNVKFWNLSQLISAVTKLWHACVRCFGSRLHFPSYPCPIRSVPALFMELLPVIMLTHAALDALGIFREQIAAALQQSRHSENDELKAKLHYWDDTSWNTLTWAAAWICIKHGGNMLKQSVRGSNEVIGHVPQEYVEQKCARDKKCTDM